MDDKCRLQFHRQFAPVLLSGNSELREGRRLWEAVGVQVSRLIRVRYGDIPLPKGLPRGGWTELDLAQTNYLRVPPLP